MNEQERIRRAEQARQILDSPLWQEAFSACHAKYLHEIERLDVEAVEEMLRAKRLLLALAEVRAHLESVLNDGKVAKETVRLQDERKRWWKG